MTTIFKPMLACSESCHHFFDQLRFPLLASPKMQDRYMQSPRRSVLIMNHLAQQVR